MNEEVLHWIRLPDITSHRGTIQRAIKSHRLDLNVSDADGRTLALRLIEDDESSLFDTLVDETLQTWKGSDVDEFSLSPWWARQNGDGDPPLCVAVRHNNVRIVRSILRMLSHVGRITTWQLGVAMAVCVEINGDGDMVNALASCEHEGKPLRPECPANALHRAVMCGKGDLVKAWLDAGAVVETPDEYGCLAAHYVADNSTLSALLSTSKHWAFASRNQRPLVSQGRQFPEYCTPVDVMLQHPNYASLLRAVLTSLRDTPLLDAIERRRDLKRQTLLHVLVTKQATKADVDELAPVLRSHDVQNGAKEYAFHLSAKQPCLAWFEALWGGSPDRIGLLNDEANRTVVHHLAANPDCSIALLNRVLKAAPHLLHIQDNEGNTPLMLCFQRQTNLRGIEFPAGTDAELVWGLVNDRRESLMWLVLRHACEHGIDPFGCILHARQHWVWSECNPRGVPILIALFDLTSEREWFAHLLRSLDSKALTSSIAQGASREQNLLHVLATKNERTLLRAMKQLTNGDAASGVNAFDAQDETALMIAVRLGHTEFVVSFVERFSSVLDLDIRAPNGLTLVDIAHEHERSEILEYLITKSERLHIADLELRLQETTALYENQANYFSCLRCHTLPRALLMLPCRHVTFCAICADRIENSASQCFVCGKKAESAALLLWTHDTRALSRASPEILQDQDALK